MSTEQAMARIRPQILSLLGKIPFNRLMGIDPVKIEADEVLFRLPFNQDFVGNWVAGILHGGAISTTLDTTGGTMAMVGALIKHHDENPKALEERLSKVGTIDLRVDYLRPGRGKVFESKARILRIGNKVAVTRMDFTNESGELIAVGTGTYLCG